MTRIERLAKYLTTFKGDPTDEEREEMTRMSRRAFFGSTSALIASPYAADSFGADPRWKDLCNIAEMLGIRLCENSRDISRRERLVRAEDISLGGHPYAAAYVSLKIADSDLHGSFDDLFDKFLTPSYYALQAIRQHLIGQGIGVYPRACPPNTKIRSLKMTRTAQS